MGRESPRKGISNERLQAELLASLGPDGGRLTWRSSPSVMWLAHRLAGTGA